MSPKVLASGARQHRLHAASADAASARVLRRICGKQPDPRASRGRDSVAASAAAALGRASQGRPGWQQVSAPLLAPKGTLRRRREAKPQACEGPSAVSPDPRWELVEHQAEEGAPQSVETLGRLRVLGAQRRQLASSRPTTRKSGSNSLRHQIAQDLEELVAAEPKGRTGTQQVVPFVSAGSLQPAATNTVKRRVKCPREVQVLINCSDREQGFVRSVTAASDVAVPELRRNLYELKAVAKHTPLTYAQVEEGLRELRERFSRGRRRRAQGAGPGQGRAAPEDRTAAQGQPSASAASADQRGRRRRTGPASDQGSYAVEGPIAAEGQPVSAASHGRRKRAAPASIQGRAAAVQPAPPSAASRRRAQAGADRSVASRKRPGALEAQSLDAVLDLAQSDEVVADELGEAEAEDDEEASAAGRKQKSKARSRAAGSVKALALKKEGRGLFKQKELSPQLQAVVKQKQACYTDLVKLVWKYIKEHGLQEKADILPDETLKLVCNQPRFHWSQLGKFLKGHVT
eukprot:TRINITY_DN65298_c0_g1_i1.p1 TRINITY_DN65298_c0_g1~~TRINITY_DN65298_c0_g1_i1.p1  ORF type:complete len:518 (+),score=104.21 TRINITY_DN65298_c0_g1_i1:29-1582(+)